ncbi:unnamed protein product [Closterium sp. NIES-54]
MAEHIDVTSLTQERLNELLQQQHESFEEIAALMAERTSLQNDVARAQQAQSQTQGTHGQPAHQASQHGSVGQPSSAASDGVARNDGDDDNGTTHPRATNAARSQPCVTISMPIGESALPSPMPLKPQRPPCSDPSQRGGPTIQAWLFTMNVFFDANYVSEDSAKIRYAVSLVARHRHEAGGLRDSTEPGRTNRTLGAIVFCGGAPISPVGRVVRRSACTICANRGLDRVASEDPHLAPAHFRPGLNHNNSNWGHRSHGTNEHAKIRAVAANAAAAPFKGRSFACNRPGHRKSEYLENTQGKGEAEQ